MQIGIDSFGAVILQPDSVSALSNGCRIYWMRFSTVPNNN
jgi:hypothetical protein